MLKARVVSVVLVSVVALGGAGMALAAEQTAAANAGQTAAPSNSNPFALYGSSGGTPVVDPTSVADPAAPNPFAIDGGGPGRPVAVSHMATPADNHRNTVQ